MSRSFLDDLNPAQHDAVTHGAGPLLVLAGAGSGKTRVLTYRIAFLLERGLAAPPEVTAVTFTNRAASEMQQRVRNLLGREPGATFVGTFHRWALTVLRSYPERAGLPPRFAILDSDEQRSLVGQAVKELGLDPKMWPSRELQARISAAVNRGQGPADLDGLDAAPELTQVWHRYSELKRSAGAVDFDDMLALTLTLLKRDGDLRAAVQRRCRYLLVDEFQDTNRLQLELLQVAVAGERSLTAVGDEDQSIYRWRGAEIDNILAFERSFPGARVVKLEENYRSTEPILRAAGALIASNRLRRGKTLYTRRGGGEPVRLFVASDERAEATWVAERVEELAPRFGLGGMAVLMRTNAQTRPFEEELTRRRIPHRVVGGLRFWQRAEVKDALAYLRLVVRPDDRLAFSRVVNVPARGIGAATLDLLAAHSERVGQPLPLAARGLPTSLTPRARLALESFFALLDQASVKRQELEPGDWVGWLLEASGLLALYSGDSEEHASRRANLAQLAAAVAEGAERGQSLEELLDAVALLEEGDDATAADAVGLLTLHAAKGLEFEVVFLAGLEQGLLPHSSARDDDAQLEEERRLAYVGMTRARRWLALTAARSRFLFGERKPTQASPFLTELPPTAYRDVSDLPVPLAPVAAAAAPLHQRQPPAQLASREPARRPGRPLPTVVVDGDGTAWRPGVKVRHPRFGTGLVLQCQGRGAQLKLVVFFDRVGRKTLLPTLAKLEQV
jgi:DNA helicase II / ATP-dependent DNA helicase PcrA